MFDQHKIQLKFLFELSELEYIQNTIDFLTMHYKSDFVKFDNSYKKELKILKDSGEYDNILEYGQKEGDYLEEFGMDKMFEFETISSTLISSILIRQVSYIEKLLISLSFIIYRKNDCPIAPDYNTSKHFTDCLKAVEYIKLVDNTDIANCKNYDSFVHIRKIRHSLAHGNKNFVFKAGDFKHYNEMIRGNDTKYILLLKELKVRDNGKNVSCELVSNIENLTYINDTFKSFIEELKLMFGKQL